MRQHVNPLSRFFQLPLELPGPEALFDDPNRPIHLDIGSARGQFLLALADVQPEWNHLGVEIRRPLVAAAQRDRDARELQNLHFLFCNANVSVQGWMEALPPDRLQRVSIQFPDPWFKKRHQKRRLINPEFLEMLAQKMQKGGVLHLATDWQEYAEQMLDTLSKVPAFKNLDPSGRYTPRPDWRPETKYERRGLRLGHDVFDISLVRK